MAAALRNRAMRFVGRAIQPTQAAAERPRIFLRSRAPTADEKKDAAIHFGQILTKKEELYNLMAAFERRYKIPGRAGEQNSMLLEQLSVQVEPRSSDPQWITEADPNPKKIAMDWWNKQKQC